MLTIASADIALNEVAAKLHAQRHVTFDGDAPTLDLAAQWQNLQWPLHGKAVVTSARAKERCADRCHTTSRITAQFDGPRLATGQGSASGVLSKESVIVASYDLKALGGSSERQRAAAVRATARLEAHAAR